LGRQNAVPLISVIVCSHNRAGFLDKAIDSLVRQSLDSELFEIILVDNGSSDGTPALCRRRAAEIGNLIHISEPRLGLSVARNAGVAKASGKYLAFLDDDAIACEAWLEHVLEDFETLDPRPGVIGGKVSPIWGIKRPSWLLDDLLGPLSVVDWSEERRPLRPREWVIGANLAVPRELLLECGGFPEDLGRRGAHLLSGAETAVIRKIRNRGETVFYDPRARVEHYIHPERLTRRWLFKRFFWGGVGSGISAVEQATSAAERRGLVMRRLSRLLNIGSLIKIAFPSKKKTRVQRICKKCSQAGFLYGALIRARG
jgi:glycosyltransferase involved in cell wall biosynthesis